MSNNPDDNEVVGRDFGCSLCGTIFHCNRAEPFCISHHPGRWHLQVVDFAPEPCPTCDTWVAPWAAEEAKLSIADRTGDTSDEGLLFPAVAVTEKTDPLWQEATAVAKLLRGQ